MSDIVERLRAFRPTYGWPEEQETVKKPTLGEQAADEIERLRRLLPEFDCRYTGGPVADSGGVHCPLGAPCQKCQNERLRAEVAKLRESLARIKRRAVRDLPDPGFDT